MQGQIVDALCRELHSGAYAQLRTHVSANDETRFSDLFSTAGQGAADQDAPDQCATDQGAADQDAADQDAPHPGDRARRPLC